MGRQQRLGITIGTAFGLVFVLVNAGVLPSPWPTVLRVAGALAFVGVQVALQAAARRPVPAGPGGVAFTRGYWLVVVLEAVALVVGLQVLARVLDAGEAGVAWVSLVVGVHFFALAAVWREVSLHLLGGALAVCGAAGLLLALTGAGEAAVATVGGVAPGFVLLAGGALAAASAVRVPQQA